METYIIQSDQLEENRKRRKSGAKKLNKIKEIVEQDTCRACVKIDFFFSLSSLK